MFMTMANTRYQIHSAGEGRLQRAGSVYWPAVVLLGSLLIAGGAGAQSTNAEPQAGSLAAPPFVEFRSLAYGRQNYKLIALPDSEPTSGAVRVHRYEAISLTQNGSPLITMFDYPHGASRWAVRLRYKLEGYDAEWRDSDQYSMHLVLKFLDQNKQPISRAEFRTSGRSVRWGGDLAASELSVRIELATVPARAVWMSIWIDSGGHDETTGVWLVDDLNVWETSSAEVPPKNLFTEDFEQGQGLDQPQGSFLRWVRDGGDLGGAQVWRRSQPAGGHGLLILDGNPRDYTAWRLNDQSLVRVVPDTVLKLKWSEVFSIGRGRGGEASYPNLPSGHYQFRIQEVNALGVPTGEEAVLPLIIAPPFYANLWFRIALAVFALTLVGAAERFAARKRMYRRLEKLEREQAVQKERARIAQDIHDDLGTVLSRIAMVSESASLEAEPGSRQQQRLGEICEASRQLTRTMEEIVWAQDPRHDSLDNTVNYFCTFASDLLTVGKVACRLDIPVDLPELQLKAEQRHELFLVFKEALNNVIKHAAATEVRISLKLSDQALHLVIEDNGRGFRPADNRSDKGHGLINMHSRLQRLGGRVKVRSEPGQGTHVEIFLPFDPGSEGPKSV